MKKFKCNYLINIQNIKLNYQHNTINNNKKVKRNEQNYKF